MSLDLTRIPTITEAPSVSEPTLALRDVRDARAGRRTVLRGIALSSLTLGATVLSLSPLGGERAARAETGPDGLRGWDRNDCRDAYPHGYGEESDTGGEFRDEMPACFGGSYMGSMYCASGWHRSGTEQDAGAVYTYRPISTACGTSSTKNAWKWKTPDGKVWRCSDGNTTVVAGGTTNTYLTICRARVS